MNGLERYTGVLESRSVDFLPRLPILMQFAAEHVGSNYGDVRLGPPRARRGQPALR